MAEVSEARANHIEVSEEALTLEGVDGRTLSVPIAWYPRLFHGTLKQRNNWRLIGAGEGVHWPDLDEDISVGDLLPGKPLGESQKSLKKWLENHEGNANL